MFMCENPPPSHGGGNASKNHTSFTIYELESVSGKRMHEKFEVLLHKQ
jgi:hypothetical protein